MRAVLQLYALKTHSIDRSNEPRTIFALQSLHLMALWLSYGLEIARFRGTWEVDVFFRRLESMFCYIAYCSPVDPLWYSCPDHHEPHDR